ncbi:MAG: DEAD/DEAH box helicase [Candidatus Pacearchaeota archaeon]
MEEDFSKELKTKPRDYQIAIFKTCKEKDCLVVLPTGTGKTLIALMMAIYRFKKFPLEKILVLAPTRPLIEQHLESFRKNIPDGWADMQLFTGKTPSEKRKKIWQTAEIIFSTPQCIANDLKKKLYELTNVSLLIVDECHRCLKNYSYNIVAQLYKIQSLNKKVLGLTASPGSDKDTISQVCKNLGIEAVEIRTRDSMDVKPYLQELEFEKIEVDFPSEFIEIRALLQELENNKIHDLKNHAQIYENVNKITLLKIQSKLMDELKHSRDFNKMLAVSSCSQALKISHALELIETQTISSLIEYLKSLYKQAEEKKSKGVQKLVKDPLFTKAYSLATTSLLEHPKLEKLKELVSEQFQKNQNSKIIIFAQFRETVRKISETLNKLPNVKSKVFVGQAIKKNERGETGLKQKEQKEIIEKFRTGKINVLVATSIAEEGLDIPEVNEVIFYEPVPSAIRKIQRAGRTARLVPGSLKILITKKTRDEAHHYAAYHKEKRMHSAINQIKKELDKNNQSDKKEQEKLF